MRFRLIKDYIQNETRPIEKAIFSYYFNDGNKSDIATALTLFQNSDGGFGKSIEPDYRLEESSPLATSIGLRYLSSIDNLGSAQEMIGKAVECLENTFNKDRNGWYSVPKSVNDYPHAPWWTYKDDIGMTVIDYSWGNPSAELIGYLYKYKEYLKYLDVEALVTYAIDYFNNRTSFDSEHEVYCYIHMYNNLDEEKAAKLEDKLREAITQLICLDESEWINYVPMPIKFIEFNSDNFFGITHKEIDKNLDYIVNMLEESNKILPNWKWDNYEDEWKVAKEEWCGTLTLEALLKLKKFNRL